MSIEKCGKHHTVRRWTELAKDCYYRGCSCSDCYYDKFFKESGQKCKMKITVLELVRVLGIPEGDERCQKQIVM